MDITTIDKNINRLGYALPRVIFKPAQFSKIYSYIMLVIDNKYDIIKDLPKWTDKKTKISDWEAKRDSYIKHVFEVDNIQSIEYIMLTPYSPLFDENIRDDEIIEIEVKIPNNIPDDLTDLSGKYIDNTKFNKYIQKFKK